MSRGRWLLAVSLVLGLTWLACSPGLALQASACEGWECPDLQFNDPGDGCLTLSQGAEGTLRVSANIELLGALESPGVDLRFSWRRVDKSEICGVVLHYVDWASGGATQLAEIDIDTTELLSGYYELVAQIDPSNAVTERDETNNQCLGYFRITTPVPAIRLTKLETVPASPIQWGDTAQVATSLENTSDVPVGDFAVEFSLKPLSGMRIADAAPTSSCTCTGSSSFCLESLGKWIVAATYPIDVDIAVDCGPQDVTFGLENAPAGATLSETGAGTAVFRWVPTFADVGRIFDDIRIRALTADGQEATETLVVEVRSPSDWDDGDVVVVSAARLAGLAAGRVLPLSFPLDSRELLQSADGLEGKGWIVPAPLPRNLSLAVRVRAVWTATNVDGKERESSIEGALTIEPSTADRAELQIVELTFNRPLPLEWNRTLTARATIVNTGGFRAENAEVVFEYRRHGDGEDAWEEFASRTISSLPPQHGANTAAVEGFLDNIEGGVRKLIPGVYDLRVSVDIDAPEIDENNNSMDTSFTVQGSELRPVSLDVTPGPIHRGATLAIVAGVANQGPHEVPWFTVGFYINDVRVATSYYQDDPGLSDEDVAYHRVQINTSDLEAGSYVLRVVADPDDSIPELDEADNELNTVLVILEPEPRLAELHATDVELLPGAAALEDGEEQRISATVWNTGDITAGHFRVRFTLSYCGDAGECWNEAGDACVSGVNPEGLPCASVDVPSLERDAKVIITTPEPLITDDLPNGEYRLRIAVDPVTDATHVYGEVSEQDELNNVTLVSFRIGAPEDEEPAPTPYPNLVFRSLDVAPKQGVDARQLLTIQEAIVWNAGLVPTGEFDVALCWEGEDGLCLSTGGTAHVTSLDGEAEIDLAEALGVIEAPSSVGKYRLRGMADIGNAVDERGRVGDNQTSVTVLVTGMIKPDLAVEEVWFSGDAPFEVGTSVRVFARVRNVSRDAGAGSFRVRFEQLDGGPIRDFSVARLNPQASIELAFDVVTSVLGDFVVRVTADVDNAVVEGDDDDATNNNSYDASFTVVSVPPVPVEVVASLGGNLRFLNVDGASDVVFAGSSNGHVAAFRHGEPPELLFDVTLPLGGDLTALALAPGRALYAASAATGVIYILDPASGEVHDDILLPESLVMTCMTATEDGTLVIGTLTGLLAFDGQGDIASVSELGEVLAISVRESADRIYVITPSALHVLDGGLGVVCQTSGFSGDLTALSVGPGGVYVATNAGTVHAFSLCQSGQLAPLWRYPQSGDLGSSIASVIVDPRDYDPIYVAVRDGRLIALDSSGQELWVYDGTDDVPLAELAAAPAWDARTGRVFVVDVNGVPHVLGGNGTDVLWMDGAASSGVRVESSLVIDEFLMGAGGDARLLRAYYFGGDDGMLYVIQTER